MAKTGGMHVMSRYLYVLHLLNHARTVEHAQYDPSEALPYSIAVQVC